MFARWPTEKKIKTLKKNCLKQLQKYLHHFPTGIHWLLQQLQGSLCKRWPIGQVVWQLGQCEVGTGHLPAWTCKTKKAALRTSKHKKITFIF